MRTKLYWFKRSLFFLLLLNTQMLIAQSDGGQAATVLVEGQVVDETNQTPLEFATVSVYNAVDSSLVGGGTTDIDGNFQFELEPDTYYMIFNFLAYETETIDDIEVEAKGASVDLGKITMAESGATLAEVEVVAEKSQMQLQLDKRVFNVGKDLSNTGVNAAEMLDNVPSVTVDIEGNISLRGSQNVRILINGKPSGLVMGSENALQQLSGDIIERVEVVTNPSARYDAEGEVGIINIILKKGRKDGFNGSLTLNTGVPSTLGGSYNLNWRKEKFNLFSSLGVNYRENIGGGSNFQRSTRGGTLSIFESESDRRRKRLSGNFRFGGSYFFSPSSTLTGSVILSKSDGENLSTTTYRDLDENLDLVSTTVRTNDEEDNGNEQEYSLSYEKTYSSRDHKLNIDFKWIEESDRELGDFEQTSTFENSVLLQRSDNTENERNAFISADYVQPVGEGGKFEAGVRATLREIDNDFSLLEQNAVGIFEPVPNFDDELRYTENIYAAYLMFGNKSNKFSYQFGLRGEYSDVGTELSVSGDRNDRNYFNLFPTAHFSYEITAEDQVQLSYSRRLSRPRFWYLLPFPSFDDIRNQYQGNPNLDPEYSNSFELGYLKYWDKGSLLSSVYYRYRTGVIDRITVVNDDGTTSRLPVNLSTQDAYGIEFNFNQDITDAWNFNANWNFYREITNGSFEGISLDNDAITWSSRVRTELDITDALGAQLSFNYRAPQNTAQGRSLSVYRMDIGAVLEVFNGKGTVSLNVRDVFNTRKWRRIVEQENFFSESEFQWRGRTARLSFTYRLNKDKGRGKGRGGDDD